MLTFIFGMLRSKYGATGVLVIAGLLVLALGAQTVRLAIARGALERARSDVTRLQVEVSSLASANDSAQAAIDTQAAALDKWRAQAAAAKEGWEQAAQDAARFASRASALRAELDSWRQGDYENPECRALLETDLAATCPGHARSVRERAHSLQGPDS